MAQNIIIDSGPRERQFQANQNRINIVSEGIQQAGSTAAQFLMAYQQHVKEEKEKRLAAMTMIGTRSGFNNLGPKFMNEYESLLGGTPKNPILPRDAEGNAVMPPSLEEQHRQDILKRFGDDPEKQKQILMQLEGLVKPSLSPEEAKYKDADLKIKQERADMDSWFKKERIRMEGVRAAVSASKGQKGNELTGIVVDPETKLPRPAKPGEVSLTKSQLQALNTAGIITSRKLANDSRTLLDQQRKWKLDHPKNSFDEMGGKTFQAWTKLPPSKRTPEMTAVVLTYLQDNYDQDQIEEILKDAKYLKPGEGFFGNAAEAPVDIPTSRKGKGNTTTTTVPTQSIPSTTIPPDEHERLKTVPGWN